MRQVMASDREREATILRVRAAHLEEPTSGIPLASRPPRAAMLAFLVPPLERNRYPLHQEGPDVLVFAHPFRGARIMVRFRDLGDRRTLVLVHGVAPLGVRRPSPG